MTTHVRFLVGILPSGKYFGLQAESRRDDKLARETIEDWALDELGIEDDEPPEPPLRWIVVTAEIPDVQEVEGTVSNWLEQKKPRPRTEKHDQIAKAAGEWTAPRGYGDDE